jgi:hypothetical protein
MYDDFFQSSHPLWYIPCDGGLLYLIFITFWPQYVPFDYLSIFGQWTKYLAFKHHSLLFSILSMAIIIHVYESVLARRFSQQLQFSSRCTWQWIIQTLLLGYPSLRILKRYAENKRQC